MNRRSHRSYQAALNDAAALTVTTLVCLGVYDVWRTVSTWQYLAAAAVAPALVLAAAIFLDEREP